MRSTLLPPGRERRQSHEVRYWLQLVSAQTVTEGQSSAAVRDTLEPNRTAGPHGGGFTLGTTLRGLEAACSVATWRRRYWPTSYQSRPTPTIRSPGRLASTCVAWSISMQARLPNRRWRSRSCSTPAGGRLAAPPAPRRVRRPRIRSRGVDRCRARRRDGGRCRSGAREGAGDSYSDPFERGTVGISEPQARAIMGRAGGTAELAAGLHAALTTAKLDQMAASAKVIECWAPALGPGSDRYRRRNAGRACGAPTTALGSTCRCTTSCWPTSSGVRAAWMLHGEALRLAESTAGATGESVWDRQPADRLSVMRSASARLTS